MHNWAVTHRLMHGLKKPPDWNRWQSLNAGPDHEVGAMDKSCVMLIEPLFGQDLRVFISPEIAIFPVKFPV
jgi:hypothetical protein